MVPEHGQHLKGRPRQHEHMGALCLKGTAGGRSHRVVKNDAVRREFRLLAVVLRHGQVHVPGKIRPDALQHILPQHQRLAEGGADSLLCQIVIGGSKTAGGNDDVRPIAGNVQRGPEPLRVIAHHRVPEHVHAHGGQRPGNVPGIGVGDVAEKQLRANGNDLSRM